MKRTSSIGDVAIAPTDANLVWVGTGGKQQSPKFIVGDGVCESVDGGKSWKNMGLRDSKHIARNIVDPVDSDVVYVAALGSLWGAGGERDIQNDGWRIDVGECLKDRCGHQRDGTGDGPDE